MRLNKTLRARLLELGFEAKKSDDWDEALHDIIDQYERLKYLNEMNKAIVLEATRLLQEVRT